MTLEKYEQIDTLTVQQQRGSDITLNVFRAVFHGWRGDIPALLFETEQILTSDSNRAWDANKTIEQYARERGYIASGDPGRHQVSALYSAEAHSDMLAQKIQKQIKADDRFQAVKDKALAAHAHIDREYGTLINKLKNLTSQLEDRCRQEQRRLVDDVIHIQAQVAQEVGLPEQISDTDRERLLFPRQPLIDLSPNHYYQRYSRNIPTEEELIHALNLLQTE
jgi:hypothetical protein